MFQPLITDFIKNRNIQVIFILGILLDLLTSLSIKHVMILFGLPYGLSIILYSLAPPKKNLVKARISAQYRTKNK